MPVMSCYLGTFLSIHIGLGNVSILTVMDSGFFKHSKPFTKFLHHHTTNELFFISDGCCDILSDDGVISPQKKTLVLIPSATNHCIVRKGESANFKCFRFSLSRNQPTGNDTSVDLLNAFSRITQESHKIVTIENCTNLFNLFELMRIELLNKDIMFLEKFEILLKQFYIDFFRTIMGYSKLQNSEKQVFDIVPNNMSEWNQIITGTYRDYLVDIIDCYIDTGFRQNISVVELANTLKISVSHIKRLIREIYGESFGNMVVKKRISAAMMLMNDSKPRNLQMISELVGYDSYNGFFEAFRQLTGQTPTEYSEKMKRSKQS